MLRQIEDRKNAIPIAPDEQAPMNIIKGHSSRGFASLQRPSLGYRTLGNVDLRDAVGITSLEPLKGLTKLSLLNLSNATGITSVEPLKGLRNLSQLYIADATGIKSLEPLKGLRVRFYGASEGLLATMK